MSAAHNISFLLDQFLVKYRFSFPILLFFTVKSPTVTQRSVSQENAFKKSKNPSPFLRKTIGSNIFFFSNWKQFQVFEIAKFEFKVTVHYGLWTKCIQLWPLYSHLADWTVYLTLIIYSFLHKCVCTFPQHGQCLSVVLVAGYFLLDQGRNNYNTHNYSRSVVFLSPTTKFISNIWH